MTPTIVSENSAVGTALWLQQAHEEGRPFTGLPPELGPRNDADAYAAQAAYVAALCRRRATTLAGYKIALTSQAMRNLVGYGNSISGCLLADQVVPSGSVLRHAGYGRLAVEFEVAFRFGATLPLEVAARGPDRVTLLPYLVAAHAAIELVDDRYAVYSRLPQEIYTLVADNAWNAGLVLGPEAVGWKQADLGTMQGIARIDGVEVGRGHGRDILGHPLDALAWLVQHLAGRGIALCEGDVVTTGSMVATQFPLQGARVNFEIDGLGAVHCEVQ
jgi:2-keto-4-pentenoate hydratase